MISHAAQRCDAQGHRTDTTTQELIRPLLQKRVDWTRQLRAHVVKMEGGHAYAHKVMGGFA
jgi:hypothetical protein